MISRAIVLQMEALQNLHDHPVWARIAEGTTDADKIAKAFRTMTILCDVFQVCLVNYGHGYLYTLIASYRWTPRWKLMKL